MEWAIWSPVNAPAAATAPRIQKSGELDETNRAASAMITDSLGMGGKIPSIVANAYRARNTHGVPARATAQSLTALIRSVTHTSSMLIWGSVVRRCFCCHGRARSRPGGMGYNPQPVSYTHLRAHETDSYLV